jgi:hypothetical protein
MPRVDELRRTPLAPVRVHRHLDGAIVLDEFADGGIACRLFIDLDAKSFDGFLRLCLGS